MYTYIRFIIQQLSILEMDFLKYLERNNNCLFLVLIIFDVFIMYF